ncbi:S9 family peptidase [Terriglobus saanensis]|uniref:Peptidase S9B dipeptidylpeptidase IV domain protein n=1 Tax=Terriglobus saanensis (strain ATCC BAA-1853 / DSM 23119 / SP1PR4) TaxID=401053 RepID=E8V1D0_TERSS|nr:S9 family peptidase [Terriglobus saanensis]ADV84545.1 peptidase S9B dipeptidylpeptidase IV domain protein [Terriglobus saanensis SP1PR4]
MRIFLPSTLLFSSLLLAPALLAQAPAVTAADYARAESMLESGTAPLVDHAVDRVVWQGNGVVTWRERTGGKLSNFAMDVATGAKSEKTAPEGGASGRRGGERDPALSPDGKRAVFIRDWNLWVRDIASKQERQLTHDGVKDFGYATDNAGWKHTDKPIVVWSPDSKSIATFQQDQRNTGEMYLVSTVVGHPKLEAWKYPLPGDKDVTMIERVVVDAASGKVTRLKMAPDQHRSSLCDDISCFGGWEDVQWSEDGKQLAFLSTSRDHRQENLRIADPATGDVREVMQEKAATYFESGNDKVNWKYLAKSSEVLWFSERDNWGQLYLFDTATGKLKNQITHGEGNVTQVLHVNEDTRVVTFLGSGKEPGRDPYFVHLYTVNLDGSGLKLLTPEDANHAITLAPDGRHFVDAYSRPDVPQVIVLRDNTGKIIAEIAHTDITRLKAAGWVPPVPFVTKARDGKTDLYGLLFKPSHFDAAKKYPVVNFIYPGPQTGSVGSRSFSASRRDNQALAELGFIVIALDGMGTPFRSKKFHDAYFNNLGDNTLPDQIAAIKQLAAQNAWMDLDRVGIWGHSGGGNATADAMFRYPEFYKVGIAESGNHDNRVYEDDWAEKWIGLLEGKNYEDQANESLAKNLRGHLLLAHGTMDDNVPPNNTLLVVDALIKANKDFDLIMIPNVHHGYADAASYMMRRRWDYFVKYLLGADGPHEYLAKPLAVPGR